MKHYYDNRNDQLFFHQIFRNNSNIILYQISFETILENIEQLSGEDIRNILQKAIECRHDDLINKIILRSEGDYAILSDLFTNEFQRLTDF